MLGRRRVSLMRGGRREEKKRAYSLARVYPAGVHAWPFTLRSSRPRGVFGGDLCTKRGRKTAPVGEWHARAVVKPAEAAADAEACRPCVFVAVLAIRVLTKPRGTYDDCSPRVYPSPPSGHLKRQVTQGHVARLIETDASTRVQLRTRQFVRFRKQSV